MIKITHVEHAGGHRLSLEFSDGTRGTVDLGDHLDHPFVAPLKDTALFAQSYVDAGTVCWPGDIDFAPEYLYALAHGLPRPGTFEQARENERSVSLQELRKLSGKTQAEVADLLGKTQSELSRLERRDDHLLSSLRRFVEALGGELEVVARFGDKCVKLHGV